MQKITIHFISQFFLIRIYWYSTLGIYWYSICHIYLSGSFIIYRTLLQNYQRYSSNTYRYRIPTIFFFAGTILFTLVVVCIIIPFLIWIACCTIEFDFTINVCQYFGFMYSFYHIKNLNIYVLFLLETHIFVDKSSAALQLPLDLSKIIINK